MAGDALPVGTSSPPARVASAGAAARRPGPAATARSNIRDVARLAGVSVTTVSRVLGGSDRVSPATRERVTAAMDELDYVANGHALALTGRARGSVVLISPTVTTSSFGEFAAGVERVASEHERTFSLYVTHEQPEREAVVVARLREQRASAVIWLGPAKSNLDDSRFVRYATMLDSVGARLVMCGRPRLGLPPDIPVVDYAHELGMARVVAHLLRLGHRRILFAGLDPNHSSATSRYEGYRDAHKEAGVELVQALAPASDFSVEGGEATVRHAIDSGVTFTAVVGAADQVAVGAVRSLTARGLRVPDDVSVAGFDDMPFAGDLLAPLTTARISFGDMGRQAAEIALGLTEPSDEVIGAQLVVRASTAAPRA